ncbi:hypothetical protein HKCCE2091_09190 [Rhodobacterales bacterium HKCCE2091]|nr:hypothetical protein [Rhodobacterales bacterium HKCCE2091]
MDANAFDARLRRLVRRIEAHSPDIPRPADLPVPEGLDVAASGFEAGATVQAQLEAIVRWYRPVLEIADDRFLLSDPDTADGDLRFVDPNSAASDRLLSTLEDNRHRIDPRIRSVGRIELRNNSRFPTMVGTGWILDSELGADIVVTNAHVAREFAERGGEGFAFRPGVPDFSQRQAAVIDFREELRDGPAREFPVTEIVWLSENLQPDMAILRVAVTAGTDRIAGPIPLRTAPVAPDDLLAVIGYPGSGNGYDPEPFRKVFGSLLMRKRLSPGYFEAAVAGDITYDCSTLPGSSGSVVLDIRTGEAVGLHHSGAAFDTNFAVSAPGIRAVIANRPWRLETAARTLPPLQDDGAVTSTSPAVATTGGGSLDLVVPLRISISLGDPASTTATSIQSVTGWEAAEAAAARVRTHLAGLSDVLKVQADRLFRGGMLTEDFGVVVSVMPGARADTLGLPPRLSGVEIVTEPATAETIVETRLGLSTESFTGRVAGYRRDLSDPRFELGPVTDRMRITLHVSPEAGWPVLKGFLEDDRYEQLTIGIYHMTAPHVVATLQDAASRRRPRRRIDMTIDRQKGDHATRPDDIGSGTKANDVPERETIAALEGILGDRFRWAPAAIGFQKLFPWSYHIKVAVWTDRLRGNRQEDKAFWLSSGNWQSSNVAPVGTGPGHEVTRDEVRDYNREWVAVVEHPGLAATFRHHLEQDLKDNAAAALSEAVTAGPDDLLVPEEQFERVPTLAEFRAFPPLVLDEEVTVQPLLTPDNYPEVLLGLIGEARHRIWIENQSIRPSTDVTRTPAHFLALLNAVRAKQEAGVEVRMIFREGFGQERDTLRRLRELGFPVGPDHVRFFDKCHTKGIVVDDDAVVLGSQNWTGGGTGPNRDASLLIRHPRAAAYFAEIFDYDWTHLARNRIARESLAARPVLTVPAGAESPPPPGYRRISVAEFLGET